MEGTPIRKIVDEELRKLVPNLSRKQYEILVANGLYYETFTDLVQSDVQGLINPLASMGIDVRQDSLHALGTIRYVEEAYVEDARSVIKKTLKRVLSPKA